MDSLGSQLHQMKFKRAPDVFPCVQCSLDVQQIIRDVIHADQFGMIKR